MKKRTVCFVITSRIHYARNKLVLESLRHHPNIDLKLVVGGSALIDKYGNVEPDLQQDGFKIDARFLTTLDGGGLAAMAKSAGLGLLELPTIFANLEPDVVLVRGDRYEVLSAAIAAAYMNIPVAHIEGGDVSGTIDESVRHAITKMSHIHFATNDLSLKRILAMGERPEYVFNVGSPELELVMKLASDVEEDLVNAHGVGKSIDIRKPYIIVMQHSVTTEASDAYRQISETLMAVHESGVPAVWFWPNVDAGGEAMAKRMREFRESNSNNKIHFLRHLPPEKFYNLLKNSRCLVGNSSSGAKEAALFGVPVVNIGTRQQGRSKGRHIINVGYDYELIKSSIETQLYHGAYAPNHDLYKENTANQITDVLSSIDLYTQKNFYHDDRYGN